MTKKHKIFVTGATGYIAKHIILQLLKAGHEVCGSMRDLTLAQAVKATMANHLPATFSLDEKLRFVQLDLLDDNGWNDAMLGLDVLIHTASPVPRYQPKDENELIKPAREGTLRALKAAQHAGIKRVVMTSSMAAITNGKTPTDKPMMDEANWSDLTYNSPSPYTKSKTLAERAAWDYVNHKDVDINLTTINPGFVFGPPLDENVGASLSLIRRVMKRKDPAVPAIGFESVDVRDIAQMHVKAIDAKISYNKRYIGVAKFIWMQEIAETLAAEFPKYNIITRRAPNWLVRILALFDANIKSVSQDLGQKRELSNQAACHDLGMEFKDVNASILETTHYLVDHKLV